MALWIVILALFVALWASRERLFAHVATHPLRHPDEVARRLDWEGIFARAGCDLKVGGLTPMEGGKRSWWEYIEEDCGPRRGESPQGEPPAMALWRASPRAGRDTPGAPLVLLLHGYSLSSPSVCPPALAAVRLGMGVVLADLPGHGLSAPALCGYGEREVRAIRALIGHLARRREAAHGLVIVGFSMGAAFVALSLEEMSAEDRKSIVGVVLGAPYWSLRNTMNRYAVHYLGLRNRALLMRAVARAERTAHFSVDRWDPSLRMAGARERTAGPWPPALLMWGPRDVLVDRADMDAWTAAWPGPIDAQELPSADHDGLFRDDATIEAMTRWLGKLPTGIRVGPEA